MPVEQKVRFNLPLPASDTALPEDTDEMAAFLSKALTEKKQVFFFFTKQGQDGLFILIIDSLQKKVLSENQVKLLIRTVAGTLSLSELLKDLIYALIGYDWLNKQSDFVSSYLHLLQNVVSVNAAFVKPVIGMLVDCFVLGILL